MPKSLAKPIAKPQPKVKPRKFTTRAKTMVTAMSVSALIGGWNVLSHLEALKAGAAQAASGPDQASWAVPTFTPTPVIPTPWPTIPALVIPPVAPLPAGDSRFAQAPPTPVDNADASSAQGGNSAAITLPPVAVAPLPTLGPLPDLPALPAVSQPPAPPPPASSNNTAAVSGNTSSRHHGKHSGSS